MFTNLKKQIKFEIWTHTSSVGLNATHKNQIAPWGAYTPPVFFRWDILVIFCWDISVICLAVVLKLSYQCSLAYIFSHFDRNGLIFFSHFKKISVCDRKKTAPHPRWELLMHRCDLRNLLQSQTRIQREASERWVWKISGMFMKGRFPEVGEFFQSNVCTSNPEVK